jgi:phage regulator Rha-like protein
MSELVIMSGKNIYTSSLIISENLNIKHDNVVALLKKYSTINELSLLQTEKLSTKGRAIINYLLTEDQALILVSLMSNSPEVIKFKVALVKAFIKYRTIAHQKFIQAQNSEYQLKRLESKTIRTECTDTIKEFIEYAVKQGSKNAVMYYANLSKMELKGLFLIEQKFPGIRDFMTIKQLNLIEMADEAVRLTLEEGMMQELPYKEIYLLAKAKIEAIARIFPPSPLPALLQKVEDPKCLTN